MSTLTIDISPQLYNNIQKRSWCEIDQIRMVSYAKSP